MYIFILWALLAPICHCATSPGLDHAYSYDNTKARDLQARQASNSSTEVPPLLANATQSDVEKARAIVDAAIQQAGILNQARYDHPMRNNYNFKPGTKLSKRQDNTPPLLNVTDEIQMAAALVAEADAYAESQNGTLGLRKRASDAASTGGTFWMGQIAHVGGWPWGNNPSNYTVFRDVTDPKYGAKGDGVTDDTKAIKKAAADNSCGTGCYSSTTKGAIIYFPPGTYLVSSEIETYYGTQFIGDAVKRPTIKASKSFVGTGVISTDFYVGGYNPDGTDKEWFINQSNFYRQVRNFIIDISATNKNAKVAGLHYQVAQATSVSFVDFIMSTDASTTQRGIFAENGSGGFMSDLTFTGGAFGIYGGNQQFTSQRLTFTNVQTAVQLIWDWGWTWTDIVIKGCTTGFKLISEDGTTRNIGSVMIVDTVFQDTTTAVLTFPATNKTGDGSTGITLDNVKFNNVQKAVADNSGNVYLPGSTASVDTWALGRIYVDQQLSGYGTTFQTKRNPTLVGDNPNGLPKAPFFTRAKPQYEVASGSQFVHMQQHCKGDGVSDDTVCFQSVFDAFAATSIIFVDAGTYMLKDTINIPNNAQIVGENWSQLVAYGPNFSDAKNPRPLLRVGQKGTRGTVEMQDLIFTSQGATAGVIYVEWNIRASGPGKAGMWDCHARVGGAIGTKLTSKECPPATSGTDAGCSAGSMLLHVTPDASGYFENVWLWVADHDLDDPDLTSDVNTQTQCSIYNARGILIESTTATWFYGTASEHSTFYQYQLWNAENVHLGMIQTEQPYYQPTPKPPDPFRNVVGVFAGDPAYKCDKNEPCDAGWAMRIYGSSNINIQGAGLYSWFDTYNEACVDTINCQTSMIKLSNNQENVVIHNLVTIGAVNMIDSDGTLITAKNNLAVNSHPFWSQLAVFDPRQVAKSPCNGKPVGNPTLPANYYDDIGDGSALISVVNGCPYDMTFLGKHSYQMTQWDDIWQTIPAGESIQFIADFNGGPTGPPCRKRSACKREPALDTGDDAGEAYFQLDTTDKKFEIHARVNGSESPKWRIDVDYSNIGTLDVGQNTIVDLSSRTVQWVLTGSELYGYWSSVNPPVTWMKQILDVIGERKLKYVCMPGSHDAGMSVLDGKTAFASSYNTQTQWLDIYHQLLRGSRWFDIRPCLGNGGGHYLCHYGNIGTYQGANGQTVQAAIDQVNQFMDDYPGELVILDISNESGYDTDNGYPRLTDAQWQPIIDQFSSGIKKPCVGFSGYLPNITMNEFIGDGKGCVISIMRNINNNGAAKGQYPYSSVGQYNQYSNTEYINIMAPDQVAKLKTNRILTAENDPNTNDQFYVFSWTLTGIDLSITEIAANAFNSLFGYAYQQFTPFSYPNILYVDYFGRPNPTINTDGTQDERNSRATSEIVALAMAVNLDLASQNCYTGGGTINP